MTPRFALAVVAMMATSAQAWACGDAAIEPTSETIAAASHIFSGVVTEIGEYRCEDEVASDGDAFATCRVKLTVRPEASFEGRLAPPGEVPVEIAFSARSYGPAAGDGAARIAAGLEGDVLVLTGAGALRDGAPMLSALEGPCGRSQAFASSDPLIAAALAEGRLVPNPVPVQPPVVE